MFYKEIQLIIGDKYILDTRFHRKYDIVINWKKIDCFPARITKDDIKEAQDYNIDISNDIFVDEATLKQRRLEIRQFLKQVKKVKKVIFTFI